MGERLLNFILKKTNKPSFVPEVDVATFAVLIPSLAGQLGLGKTRLWV